MSQHEPLFETGADKMPLIQLTHTQIRITCTPIDDALHIYPKLLLNLT